MLPVLTQVFHIAAAEYALIELQ